MNNNKTKSIIKNYFGKETVKLFNMLLSQKPKKADVIVFLQGDRLDRVKKVQSLYENGFGGKIVITGSNERLAELNDSHLSEIRDYFLSKMILEKNIIVDNKASNTLEQANNVIKIAKEKKWKKLIIVTSSYHLLRAYLSFRREIERQGWGGKIIMQEAGLPLDKDKLKLELEKIKKYKLL